MLSEDQGTVETFKSKQLVPSYSVKKTNHLLHYRYFRFVGNIEDNVYNSRKYIIKFFMSSCQDWRMWTGVEQCTHLLYTRCHVNAHLCAKDHNWGQCRSKPDERIHTQTHLHVANKTERAHSTKATASNKCARAHTRTHSRCSHTHCVFPWRNIPCLHARAAALQRKACFCRLWKWKGDEV